MYSPALLALADGSIFHGISIGSEGQSIGELVFNTAITGYQEIITDPSYSQQIVTFTYPHIGNTGINEWDPESSKVHAAGLVIRDYPEVHSNWRSQTSLSDYLKQQDIVAIAEIDTRHLTRILRDNGAQHACITTDVDNPEKAIQAAKQFSGLDGLDLASKVTTAKQYQWTQGSYQLDNHHTINTNNKKYHVVAYDFGVKQNILRLFADRHCGVTVVPAKMSSEELLKLNPDGVFLSNGPGDPAACDYAIANIKNLLQKDIPVFGICLGFQLLALASGASTSKMKFGHHGANHPVKDLRTDRVFITSQNHGFMVDETSLPSDLEITHRSLFDNSLQGIRHKQKPALGFQGHPEASPGPHDIQILFDEFINMMESHAKTN